MAFLGLYRDWVDCLLAPQDHRHEEGDDRSACANCRLETAERNMSNFETEIFNWYCDTVTPFALHSGIVAEMFKALRLKGVAKVLFLSGLNAVHEAFVGIREDRAKRARGE